MSEVDQAALDLVEGAIGVDAGREHDEALPRALEQREAAPRLMNGWRFALHPRLFQELDNGLPVTLRHDALELVRKRRPSVVQVVEA